MRRCERQNRTTNELKTECSGFPRRYLGAKFELLASSRWYGLQWMDFGSSALLTTGSGFETAAALA